MGGSNVSDDSYEWRNWIAGYACHRKDLGLMKGEDPVTKPTASKH